MIPSWFRMSPSYSPDHLGSILYRSKSSEVPYSTNQYMVRNFFAVSYSKPALELLRLVFRKKCGYLELLYSLLACCHLVKRFQWRFRVSWIENKFYIWTHSLYNWYLEDKYRIENISDTHHMINEFPIFTSISINQNKWLTIYWLKQTKTQHLVHDIKPQTTNLVFPNFSTHFYQFYQLKKKTNFSLVWNLFWTKFVFFFNF